MAIRTGNGLAVLDVDEKSGGYDSLEEFSLPATPSVITGRGVHYYFAGETRSRTGLRPGLDVRGINGYVVAAPSRHESGRTYEWDLVTEELPLAPFPSELTSAEVPLSEAPSELIGEGSRNATLASLAGSMRRRGMSRDAILSALLTENETRCKPPLAEREVQRIADSVSRYRPEPQAIPEITARSVPQFLGLDIPRPRYLVEGVVPEHAIGFDSGPPKSFKSFLVLDMGMALATGRPFLGHFHVPAPRTVLLIDHESSRGALADRLRRAEARFGEARSLYVISNRSFSLEDAADVDRLRLEVATIRPDLTILDPLASFIRGDENSAQQMGVVVRLLRALRDEFGTGFVVVHHTQKSKDGETTRGGERMRGSSAFYAAAEFGIWVKRVDSDIPRSNVRVELKDGEAPPPFQVHFEPERAALIYIDPFAEAMSAMTAPSRRRHPEAYYVTD